ncbi:MAG: BrnT family toxin [Lentisphaerota bacterium]
MNLVFVWDNEKAKSNILKHNVSFKEASSIFLSDENMLTIYDSEHSLNEERWITIGLSSALRVLTVVHTHRQIDIKNVEIRIISSRKSTKREIGQYKEQMI